MYHGLEERSDQNFILKLKNMPQPSFSNNTDDEIKKYIAEIYQTLKTTKKITAELKQNLEDTLEKSYVQKGNHEKFSESLNVPRTMLRSEKTFQTIDPRRSNSPKYSTDAKQSQPVKSPVTPENTKEFSPKNNGRKSAGGQQRIRNIIFRTLDRLFQVPSAPQAKTSNSKAKRDSPGEIGIDTLKRLTATESDTLPRQPPLTPSPRLQEVKQAKTSEEKLSLLKSDEDKTPTLSDDGDEVSWIYVDKPLSYRDASVSNESESCPWQTSTIPRPPDFEEDENEKENTQVSQPTSNECVKGRYKKKGDKQKSSSNKFKKRSEEKNLVQVFSPPPENISLIEVPSIDFIKRPDSPCSKKEYKSRSKLIPSTSLPNLIEFDEFESFMDCGTESFKRGARKRPSSTIKNITKAKPDHQPILGNSESTIDNDQWSTAKSFTSFYTPDQTIIAETNIIAKPSALCQEINVLPIKVPIIPLSDPINMKKLSDEELKRLNRPWEANEKPIIKHQNQMKGSTKFQAEIGQDEAKDDIRVVIKAFGWLPNSDEKIEESKNSSSEVSKSEFKSFSSPSPVPPPVIGVQTASPPPPPPLPSSTATLGTMRVLLPLTVFTQPQSGNNVFNDIDGIQLKETDAKRLKEKFPLKKSCGKSRHSFGRNMKETSKLKFNFEMFLRTWNFHDFSYLLNCISTLNPATEECNLDKECFAALAKLTPKIDLNKIRDILNSKRELDEAEKFLLGLSEITRLNEKLQCIEFSIDFSELCANLTTRIDSFSNACIAIKTSEKFRKIIDLTMAFLNCLNSEGSRKIYGFDIQDLYKLATKVSPEDDSTTLLQLLIEYLLSNPNIKDAIDFYEEFKDLADISKISLAELNGRVQEWKKSLMKYNQEIYKSDENGSLKHAILFSKNAEKSLSEFTDKLKNAEENFYSCKERYGLSTSEILETNFFESISKFTASFQKIHMELVVRQVKKQKMNLESSKIPVNVRGNIRTDNIQSRRKSYGDGIRRSHPPEEPAVDDLHQHAMNWCKENQKRRVRPQQK